MAGFEKAAPACVEDIRNDLINESNVTLRVPSGAKAQIALWGDVTRP